ncbi:MAG TPA: cytochrome c [Sphingomonadaceae bacterium]|nr:cytochrome c [Sphingomonadaceae bacterium]
MKKKTLSLVMASLSAIGAITASATAQTVADADGAFMTSSRFSETDGESMYKHVCAGCHMPDGKGSTGAGFYPSLSQSERLEAGGYPVYVLMEGLNGMPPLGRMMTDDQVADVVNYVRTHFGNKYKDPVAAADVAALR